MKVFRASRWGLAIFAILAACAALLARIGAEREAAATRSDLENVLNMVPAAHFAYLGARIATGMQLARLAGSEMGESEELLSNLAQSSVDFLPGIGAFLLINPTTAALRRTIPEVPPGADLAPVLEALEEAERQKPGMMATHVADIAGWGRTLFLRFPIQSGGAANGPYGILVEAVLLAPLYETLFSQEFRERLDFDVTHDSLTLYEDVHGPWPDSPFRASRSFRVAGQEWTVSVWPHQSLILGRLRQTWWIVFGVGLAGAAAVSGLVTLVLRRWAALGEKIQLTEARFHEIVEGAEEMIVSTTADGRVTDANPAAAQMTGRSLDELRGYRFAALLKPESVSDFTPLLQADAGPAVQSAVLGLQRPDGTSCVVESVAHRRRDPSGAIRFDVIAHNVTARQEAEAALTAARDRALEAARLKSEFLANMSHEIRTPMNGIIGMTELALLTALTAEQREYLEMTKASADALLTVINDILDFSKIEAGKLEIERTDFNLRDELGDTIKALALRAHAKGLEVALRIAPDLPDVVAGDPGRLRQILVNLVGNAIKFTSRGEVAVDVDIADCGLRPAGWKMTPRTSQLADVEAGFDLRFAVRDTGIGIPLEKQRTIFNAFEQGDGSTTRKYGGTGLGLAIASHLVELMGGRIWVESQIGNGSTFYFTIRFGRPKQPAAPPPPRHPVNLSGLPVLVVDDNATNRFILEETLRHWHMQPTLADGGGPALRLMKRRRDAGGPFRLVLMDVHMPDMDGFEVVEQIKRDPLLAGATIMMLTSGGQPGDTARCQELGVAAYVTKPIRQSDLLRAILDVLGAQSVDLPPGAPLSQAGTKETVPPASALDSPRARPVRRHGRGGFRILLAEDHPVNQKLAVRILERERHEVVVANNGREAVSLFEKEGFDLVLMDVQMPGLDGFEATAAIREREKTTGTHVPIVAMTAYALTGDREHCLAAGMDAYLSKPIRAEELLVMIDSLVPRPSAMRAPAA